MELTEQIVVGRDYSDLEKFGNACSLYIGKHLVGKGEEAHLTAPLLLDALRPHVIVICGKRGTGKSYTMGVIAEEIAKLPAQYRENLCALIIDTQGIFWTMKHESERPELLNAWNLKPRGFKVEVYVPLGQRETFEKAKVEFDGVFSISPSQLLLSDWLSVLDLELRSIEAVLLQRALEKLKNRDFSLDELSEEILRLEGFEKEKQTLASLINSMKRWGIFGEARMPNVFEGGKITVLDVSLTPQALRALLVAIVARKIFETRTIARREEELAKIERRELKRVPMIWLLIDEAHNFIPCDGRPASLAPLLRIVREGRQPGITLVLATQQPNKLHLDALAQCDLIIAHRLTAKADIEALKTIMQTYIEFDLTKYMDELPRVKGVGIILDDNSERLYKVQIRPRQSWHAGASPIAAKL